MPQASAKRLSGRNGQGFTLIELVVTVAVLGILAAVAIPSMSGVLNASRLSGTTEELTAALQLARVEAIRRSARVTVCGSSDGATCANNAAWSGWIVTGRDNAAPAGSADDVIRSGTLAGNVQLTGPAGGIRFRPSGIIDAEQTLTICMPVENPGENKRVMTIMISGSVWTAKESGGGTC